MIGRGWAYYIIYCCCWTLICITTLIRLLAIQDMLQALLYGSSTTCLVYELLQTSLLNELVDCILKNKSCWCSMTEAIMVMKKLIHIFARILQGS